MHIPDPCEMIESRAERMMEMFVDENTCMICGKRQEHECVMYSADPSSPLACDECAGIDVGPKP